MGFKRPWNQTMGFKLYYPARCNVFVLFFLPAWVATECRLTQHLPAFLKKYAHFCEANRQYYYIIWQSVLTLNTEHILSLQFRMPGLKEKKNTEVCVCKFKVQENFGGKKVTLKGKYCMMVSQLSKTAPVGSG